VGFTKPMFGAVRSRHHTSLSPLRFVAKKVLLQMRPRSAKSLRNAPNFDPRCPKPFQPKCGPRASQDFSRSCSSCGGGLKRRQYESRPVHQVAHVCCDRSRHMISGFTPSQRQPCLNQTRKCEFCILRPFHSGVTQLRQKAECR